MAHDLEAWHARQQETLTRRHDNDTSELRRLRRVLSDRIRGEYEARILLASARRELEALRGVPSVGAPSYDGHVWSGHHAPYHLVPYRWVPYPCPVGIDPEHCPSLNVPVPDIWEPASKALCKAPWVGQAMDWPLAHEVCRACVAQLGEID